MLGAYLRDLRCFDRNVRLYLISGALIGLVTAVAQLVSGVVALAALFIAVRWGKVPATAMATGLSDAGVGVGICIRQWGGIRSPHNLKASAR